MRMKSNLEKKRSIIWLKISGQCMKKTRTVDTGFFNREENDCYMYKVQDVKLTTTLLERIFGLGTITCYTGDVTNAELKLIHIRKSKEVKNYLLKASEAARMKRRTLNTLDIGAAQDLSDALDS